MGTSAVVPERARAGSRRGRLLPAEAATFMFSLKQPLFARLANEFQDDAVGLIASILETTELVDQLGLFMVDEYAKASPS